MTVGEMKAYLANHYEGPEDDATEVVAMFAHGDAGVAYAVDEVSGLSHYDDDDNETKEDCLVLVGEEIDL